MGRRGGSQHPSYWSLGVQRSLRRRSYLSLGAQRGLTAPFVLEPWRSDIFTSSFVFEPWGAERAHITLRTGALASGALYVVVRIWGALLGSFGAILGSLGALWGRLGASWRPCAPWVKGLGCLWPSWGPPGSLLRASSPLRALFGACVGPLRRFLGPSWDSLGALLGRLGASWRPCAPWVKGLGCLWPSWGPLGSLLRASSPLRALFGASVGLLRRLLGPSWGPLGALLGRLGALLGANGAVLGRSLGPLGPSWAVLGPKSREP